MVRRQGGWNNRLFSDKLCQNTSTTAKIIFQYYAVLSWHLVLINIFISIMNLDWYFESVSFKKYFDRVFSSPHDDALEYRRWKMTAVNNVKEKSWTVLNRENMRFITGLIIYLKTASACWWLKSTKVEVRRYPLKKSSFKPQCKLLGGLPTVTYSSRNVLSFVRNIRHIICLVQFRFLSRTV